jgi:hypothetical protein
LNRRENEKPNKNASKIKIENDHLTKTCTQYDNNVKKANIASIVLIPSPTKESNYPYTLAPSLSGEKNIFHTNQKRKN